MRTFLILILLVFCQLGYSQIVYNSKSLQLSRVVKYSVVEKKKDADIKVYKVSSKEDAVGNQGLWFESSNASIIEVLLYEVAYEQEADLKVFYVDDPAIAGWRNNSKKHLLEPNTNEPTNN